eukprot:CAMPEP_0206238446 /NCGR_PEP_ID=MMETSP0047_2-20121206/14824_1 /ASSEMBLY_ACC=CAM_ASM_000192 /TAXON_ID=195065 /ORGANISM="Chroomonas mesostigmatica_cf, Strain CCMP1168" /LENGTH=90 /DNA_ID=CAMNT_0053662991 /DNA_START=27 /DNA_END=296 /DNA_ORIENTATION=-
MCPQPLSARPLIPNPPPHCTHRASSMPPFPNAASASSINIPTPPADWNAAAEGLSKEASPKASFLNIPASMPIESEGLPPPNPCTGLLWN